MEKGMDLDPWSLVTNLMRDRSKFKFWDGKFRNFVDKLSFGTKEYKFQASELEDSHTLTKLLEERFKSKLASPKPIN